MVKSANNGKNNIFTLLDLGFKKTGEYQLYDESCLNKDNSFINIPE